MSGPDRLKDLLVLTLEPKKLTNVLSEILVALDKQGSTMVRLEQELRVKDEHIRTLETRLDDNEKLYAAKLDEVKKKADTDREVNAKELAESRIDTVVLQRDVKSLQTSVKKLQDDLEEAGNPMELFNKVDVRLQKVEVKIRNVDPLLDKASKLDLLKLDKDAAEHKFASIGGAMTEVQDKLIAAAVQVKDHQDAIAKLLRETLCQECVDMAPSITCRDCSKRLCSFCDAQIHNVFEMEEHIREGIFSSGSSGSYSAGSSGSSTVSAMAITSTSTTTTKVVVAPKPTTSPLAPPPFSSKKTYGSGGSVGTGGGNNLANNDILQRIALVEESLVNLQHDVQASGLTTRQKEEMVAFFADMKKQLEGKAEKSTVDAVSVTVTTLEQQQNDHVITLRDAQKSLGTIQKSVTEIGVSNPMRDHQITELRHALAQLGKLMAELAERLTDFSTKKEAVAQKDNMLSQIKELASMLKDQMKKELRKFEKDLQGYVQEKGHSGTSSKTSLGRMHFKCLCCDQVTASVSGPHSLKYSGDPAKGLVAQGGMMLDKGHDVTLQGSDGNIYRGREEMLSSAAGGDATKHGATGSEPAARVPSTFRVLYTEKQKQMVQPRPDSPTNNTPRRLYAINASNSSGALPPATIVAANSRPGSAKRSILPLKSSSMTRTALQRPGSALNH